jgi:hypothetical protein
MPEFPACSGRPNQPLMLLMKRCLLICLSPTVLAYVILLTGMMSGKKMGSDSWVPILMLLITIGACVSGGFVSARVFRSVVEPVFLKWLLAILTFIGVGLGYFALATAGCCGIAVMGDSI